MRRYSGAPFNAVLVAIAGCALIAGASPAMASPAVAGTTAAGPVWGSAKVVPGLKALSNTGNEITALSCPAAGDCAAGGWYSKSGAQQAFVVNEVNGVWGTARPVSGLAKLNSGRDADIESVSCASAGNCVAAGFYGIGQDSTGFEHTQAFVVGEVHGTWGAAKEVPGTAKLNTGTYDHVESVSCTKPGDCSAGGFYTGKNGYSGGFVVTESGGTWGTAETVPGTPTPTPAGNTQILSVSCAAPGDCAASGASISEAIVVTQKAGVWGKAEVIPGIKNLTPDGAGAVAASVSCQSAGNCTTGGWYDPGPAFSSTIDNQVFVATETSGTWGAAQEVPGSAKLNAAKSANLYSVSCASPGNCSAGGTYASSSLNDSYRNQAFVVNETGGKWGNAQEVPGTATLNAKNNAQVNVVSCPSAGNCSAGGYYTDAHFRTQAFVVDESADKWGTAKEVPGSGKLNAGGYAQVASLSCASASSCAAGGYVQTAGIEPEAFVVTK
jgi:hypothetical protein